MLPVLLIRWHPLSARIEAPCWSGRGAHRVRTASVTVRGLARRGERAVDDRERPALHPVRLAGEHAAAGGAECCPSVCHSCGCPSVCHSSGCPSSVLPLLVLRLVPLCLSLRLSFSTSGDPFGSIQVRARRTLASTTRASSPSCGRCAPPPPPARCPRPRALERALQPTRTDAQPAVHDRPRPVLLA